MRSYTTLKLATRAEPVRTWIAADTSNRRGEREGRTEDASAARRTDAWEDSEELEDCVEDVELEEVD